MEVISGNEHLIEVANKLNIIIGNNVPSIFKTNIDCRIETFMESTKIGLSGTESLTELDRIELESFQKEIKERLRSFIISITTFLVQEKIKTEEDIHEIFMTYNCNEIKTTDNLAQFWAEVDKWILKLQDGIKQFEGRIASYNASIFENEVADQVKKIKSLIEEKKIKIKTNDGESVDDIIRKYIANLEFFGNRASFQNIYYALKAGNVKIVENMIRMGANFEKCFCTLIINNEVALVDRLFNICIGLKKHCSKQFNPLQLAASHGYIDMVDCFLKYQFEIDSVNEANHTALHLAIIKGHTEIAKHLIEKGADIEKIIKNNERNNGKTPLFLAVEYKNVELVNLLVGLGANINVKDSFENSPLHYAVEDGNLEIMKILIDNGADIEARDFSGATPLFVAAKCGIKEAAELLLEGKVIINEKIISLNDPDKRANMNVRLNDGESILYALASSCNDVSEFLHYLIGKGLRVNEAKKIETIKSIRYSTPLSAAVRGRNISNVLELFENGAKPNIHEIPEIKDDMEKLLKSNEKKDIKVNSPLDIAISEKLYGIAKLFNGQIEYNDSLRLHIAILGCVGDCAYKLLESESVNINLQDNNGNTPLHLAIAIGSLHFAIKLMKAGADTSIKNNKGKTAFDIANKILKLIPNIKKPSESELFEIAEDITNKFGVDLLVKDSQGNLFNIITIEDTDYHKTMLKDIVDTIYGDIRSNLIESLEGQDFEKAREIQDNKNIDSLYLASVRKDVEMMAALLIKNGARYANNDLIMELYCKLESENMDDIEDAVTNILKSGIADINFQDENGNTLLHQACIENKIGMVKILNKLCADVRVRNKDGLTAFDIARDRGYKDICLEIWPDVVLERLEEQSDPNLTETLVEYITASQQDEYGNTLLHRALIKNKPNAARELIISGIDVTLRNRDGMTAFDIANSCYLDIANMIANSAVTALFDAVRVSDSKKIEKILNSGITSVDSVDEYGYTPLHLALDIDNIDIAHLLIIFGASIDIGNKSGLTALDIIRRKEQSLKYSQKRYGLTGLEEAQLEFYKGIRQEVKICSLPSYLRAVYSPSNMIAQIRRYGLELDVKQNGTGNTLLHIAAIRNNLNAALSLINLRIDVTIKNKDGLTAFDIANANNFKTVASEILNSAAADLFNYMKFACSSKIRSNADLNKIERIINENKRIADFCKKIGNFDVIKEIIELARKNAKLNEIKKNMGFCGKNTDLNEIERIVKFANKDANLDKIEKFIEFYRKIDDLNEIEKIINSKIVDANLADGNGNTLLHLAATKNDELVTKLLIGLGADVTLKNKNSKTAFDIANNKGYTNIANMIANSAATALFDAVRTSDSKKIEKILKSKIVDVNLVDERGNTSLHLAAINDNVDIVALLIDNGANMTLRNNDGLMAAEITNNDAARMIKQRYLQKFNAGRGRMDSNISRGGLD